MEKTSTGFCCSSSSSVVFVQTTKLVERDEESFANGTVFWFSHGCENHFCVGVMLPVSVRPKPVYCEIFIVEYEAFDFGVNCE